MQHPDTNISISTVVSTACVILDDNHFHQQQQHHLHQHQQQHHHVHHQNPNPSVTYPQHVATATATATATSVTYNDQDYGIIPVTGSTVALLPPSPVSQSSFLSDTPAFMTSSSQGHQDSVMSTHSHSAHLDTQYFPAGIFARAMSAVDCQQQQDDFASVNDFYGDYSNGPGNSSGSYQQDYLGHEVDFVNTFSSAGESQSEWQMEGYVNTGTPDNYNFHLSGHDAPGVSLVTSDGCRSGNPLPVHNFLNAPWPTAGQSDAGHFSPCVAEFWPRDSDHKQTHISKSRHASRHNITNSFCRHGNVMPQDARPSDFRHDEASGPAAFSNEDSDITGSTRTQHQYQWSSHNNTAFRTSDTQSGTGRTEHCSLKSRKEQEAKSRHLAEPKVCDNQTQRLYTHADRQAADAGHSPCSRNGSGRMSQHTDSFLLESPNPSLPARHAFQNESTSYNHQESDSKLKYVSSLSAEISSHSGDPRLARHQLQPTTHPTQQQKVVSSSQYPPYTGDTETRTPLCTGRSQLTDPLSSDCSSSSQTHTSSSSSVTEQNSALSWVTSVPFTSHQDPNPCVSMETAPAELHPMQLLSTGEESNTSSQDERPQTAQTPLVDVDHLLASGVTVAGFKPRPIIRKRRKVTVPSTQKDTGYWQKRKKNNDSAKRSREAKKEKEKNFYRRALELECENYFLKERLGQVEAHLHAVAGVAPTVTPHSFYCNNSVS